jgi:hypothetical protein
MADDNPTPNPDLRMLGEMIIALRDEMRAAREDLRVIRVQLRRIEDRMERQDELILSLMRSDQDLERRLRAVERAQEDA